MKRASVASPSSHGVEYGTSKFRCPCGSISSPFGVQCSGSNLFVVARNKHIAPKQRRVERVPPGSAVQEFQNDPRGSYWYVVTALEVSTGGGAPRPVSGGKN